MSFQKHCEHCQPAMIFGAATMARIVLLLQRMLLFNANVEPLTNKIIACALEVHKELGPGLLESVYQECLVDELQRANIEVESDRSVPIEYKGRRIRGKLRLDLLVAGCVVVELKAVDSLHPVYLAQVITYLKLTGCPAGLIMNFNTASLRSGLRRLDHPDLYRKGPPVTR